MHVIGWGLLFWLLLIAVVLGAFLRWAHLNAYDDEDDL